MKNRKLIEIHCAICALRERKVQLFPSNIVDSKINVQTFSARRIPDKIHYRVVICKRCGLLFSDPIFPKYEIDKFYRGSKFDYEVESNYLKKTYGYYFKKIITSSKDLRLLDIGCGNGFFLEEAADMGIKEVFGVEPGKASVKKAPLWLRKRIKVDIFKPKLFKKRSFDLITCFQTFDHITNPKSFLKEARNLLKTGGKTLFIQHDTGGLSVKLLGERSPIFDIEHIYLFNKKTLKKIFEQNGFRVIEVFDVKNRYPLSYWVRMLPFPKVIKPPILLFLNITRLGILPIAIKAGNIGIIATPTQE
jgi:SAM-dependent methyltransferase